MSGYGLLQSLHYSARFFCANHSSHRIRHGIDRGNFLGKDSVLMTTRRRTGARAGAGAGGGTGQRPQIQRHTTRAINSSAMNPTATASARAAPPAAPEPVSAGTPTLTYAELRALAIASSVPFIGFGFMDNAILILAGDAIDTSLGVAFGISTLCAAAIGNIISDVAGIVLGAVIEDWCATVLKLPVPQLTAAQRQLRSVRLASQCGTGFGMVLGCIIGMFPLLLIDSNKIQRLKREAHLDSMFRDIMTEANRLIGAQRACLFLVVDPQVDHINNNNDESFRSSRGWWGWFRGWFTASSSQHPKPTPDGKFLYAKYDAASSGSTRTAPTPNAAAAATATATSTTISSTSTTPAAAATAAIPPTTTTTTTVCDTYIPLGRGLVSRAALTGESWNIYSVPSEPEFVAGPDSTSLLGGDANDDKSGGDFTNNIQNMLCVPVLDAQGRAIAVIQAINKISPGTTGGTHTSTHTPMNPLPDGDGDFLSLPLLSPTSGFTNNDVLVLQALATHISASLQRMFYDDLGGGSDEVRLKDTISLLRDFGVSGISSDKPQQQQPQQHSSSSSSSSMASFSHTHSSSFSPPRNMLFPEE